MANYNASANGGPNILGGGMYQAPPIAINQGAFNNAAGGAAGSALNGIIPNYLGATTAPVTAAQAAPASPTAAYGTATGGLSSLAGTYGAMAAGQGPSLATVTAQQQGAANLAGAESMLGSARGAGSPAAAQQAAANAQATGGQQVAANAVAGRTQEELGALGALGNTYGTLGSLGNAQQGLTQQQQQFNAQQQNQIGLANQANTSQQYNQYGQLVAGVAGQQQQGQIAGQQLAANTSVQQQQIAANAYANSAANNNKIFGQALGAATNAAGSIFGV